MIFVERRTSHSYRRMLSWPTLFRG